MSQPSQTSGTGHSSLSSASPEVQQQPPFPQPQVNPEARSPKPTHPNAEALLNAAAQHVFPESEKTRMPPSKESGDTAADERAEVTEEGRYHSREDHEDREEEPIIGGTPLDEMTPMESPGAGTGGFPFNKAQGKQREGQSNLMESTIPENEATIKEASGKEKEFSVKAVRPGMGPSKEIGSVRMGASALMSALNALPWEDEEDNGSSSDSSDDEGESRPQQSKTGATASRPKVSRMHSSLHTIRPDAIDTTAEPTSSSPTTPRRGHHHALHFPFRENTIARKAQSPSVNELEYQLAFRRPNEEEQSELARDGKPAIVAELQPADGSRRDSAASTGSDESMPPGARSALNDQITKEEDMAGKEESAEIAQAAGLPPSAGQKLDLQGKPSDHNTAAALREGGARDEEIDDRMSMGKSGERQRMRKEKLSEKLMQVFGLAEREEVLEEMRCWLLRSVMLKGYMYLTAKHICFFAHMPDKANVVIKSGPLSKKASRTKLMTKYWIVLKNDVMSWYESTADPYFPRGSFSLQYVSSCDAIDDLRFKVRTPERNYTFSADTESARDEWIKAIEKVMFKTQHEGENVKLVIPFEAVLEIEKSPTLEFAETIEIRCVDADDHMSVDSYFFASFSNTERTIRTIQKLIDARPPSLLPRRDSGYSDDEEGEELRRQKHRSDKTILGKVGSVFKPLLGKHDDSSSTLVQDDKEEKKGGSILGLKLSRKSHDSEETLHAEESTAVESDYDGYPPRQTGPPPKEGEKGWSSWIKKPVSKVLHPTTSRSGASVKSSSSRASLPRPKSPQPPTRSLGKTPSVAASTGTGHSIRLAPGETEHVTEIVEPNTDDSDSNASEDDDDHSSDRRARRRSSARSGLGKSEYAMLDGSKEGREEEGETARKFRSVFSLSDKEELIDHFPGYLYRVLPVSGRFFVSTNYFCFRSSQLLYKTKMMIPIRDLYGLKAQKAFRFNHSGLIIVIKGHEEIFLEFSSDKRREACVRILEQRMDILRDHDPSETAADAAGAHNVENRIMEDLDESAPLDARSPPPSSPNGMFASTTSTFLEFKPEPMRVTCLTIGSRGDVQPYIALCKGLQAEGHRTKIATHGEYKDWVEGHGIEFASVGGDPAELMQMCVDNGMFTVSFMREGLSKFRGWLDDLLMSSWEACQDSDLLIESPSAMGGVHIAEALQIPYFRAFTMPWTRTRAYPHAFAVPEHKKGGAYNYMTYTMFDQVFWKAISGQVNRWRRKVMGIEPTNFDKLEQHKIPFLYNFSPSVVPPPLDWTEWTHVTGYWFLENADESAAKNKKWSPPEDLTKFMETAKSKGKKIVYIGFGSIVVSDPQEMTRCVIDSVLEADVYAILSKGWSDRGSKAKDDEEGDDKDGADGVKYPDQIYSIDSIDHSWLFTRIDAACHHGGAGTTGASLRAGIPTIIKPFFGDQAFWSERVESLNVGSAVRKLTVESLSEALKKATTDEKQIAKAKVVGEIIRKENGVVRAIESIYRDLEYAKSQIKPLATKDENGIPLGKVSSIFSGHSIDTSSITSGLSSLGLARTDSPNKRNKSRPSSLSTAASLKPGAHGDRSEDIAEDDENDSAPKSSGGRMRDPSAEGEKEQGSDGSWSVVSGEGRSGASSPAKGAQQGQGFALAPALA